MKINKLSVASFGKLRNSQYELGSGLNVIYGPNESGKSTMLSFMRFMLFGCHGRKGSSNITLEEKYQPWDNTALSGSMDFEAYGQSYHTSRSIGIRKEYGTLNSNGSSAFEGIEPGEAIYNMNESAFLRSFYLSANSCKIAADKNDDILKGLSNFADTGDEKLSYDSISAKINGDKKQAVAQIGDIEQEILSLRKSLERIGVLKERSKILNEKLYEADSAIQQLSDNLGDKIDKNNKYQRNLEKYATTKLYQQAKVIIVVLLTIMIIALCATNLAPVAIPVAALDAFTLLLMLTGKRKLNKLRREMSDIGQDAKLYSDDVKTDITKTDAKKSEVLKEIGAIEAELEKEYSYEDICSQIDCLTEKKQQLDKRIRIIEKARYILDTSYAELKNLFSPVLNKKASEIFSAITNQKYDNIIVSDRFDIKVKSDYDYKSSQMYSAGTYEMMYFSLRLALCDILGGDENLPVFLDDCFALCDDERAKIAVEFLAQYAKQERQIVFCTCHGRELELFSKLDDVNIINLIQ